MKVRVNTKRLLELVSASKRRLLEEYAEQRAAFPEAEEAYRRQLVKALERELVRVKRGGALPEGYTRYSRGRDIEGVVVDVGARKPSRPHKPDTKRHDHRLAELRLETREALLVDRYAREWHGLL